MNDWETTPGGIILPVPHVETPEEKPVSEMLERMAKAVGERMFQRNNGGTMIPWEYSPERRAALDYVRAAVEAMREPLEWMVLMADRKAERVFGNRDDNLSPYSTWQIMIDTILEPTPPVSAPVSPP